MGNVCICGEVNLDPIVSIITSMSRNVRFHIAANNLTSSAKCPILHKVAHMKHTVVFNNRLTDRLTDRQTDRERGGEREV